MTNPRTFALAILLLLVGCNSAPPANTTPPAAPAIDSFGVNPSPVPANVKAVFSWSVTGTGLTCRVDLEGNGTFDQTLENCSSSTRISHTFGVPGTYAPKLQVSGTGGVTIEKSTQVTVIADNHTPVVLNFSPGPGNPANFEDLAIQWSWRVEDRNLDSTTCTLDADSDGIAEYSGLCSGIASTAAGRPVPANLSQHSVRHLYAARGRYTATLKVADPYSVTTVTATTRSPWNTAPVITNLKATSDLANVLNASFQVSDADGDPLKCRLEIQPLNLVLDDDCSRSAVERQLRERVPHRVTLSVSDGFTTVSSTITTRPIRLGLSSGDSQFCYLARTGQPYCWGNGEKGQLGTGESESRENLPQAVDMSRVKGRQFIQVGMGVYHTCGLTPLGKAYCWGHDRYGQLGDNQEYGNSIVELAPVPVNMSRVAGGEFVLLAVGAYHTCGLTPEGAAYCWGDNGYGYGADRSGKLGNSESEMVEPTPHPVEMSRVAGGRLDSLSAGWYNTCGLTPEGKAYCWGDNWSGQLGKGFSGPQVDEATAIPLNNKVSHISVWADHVCATDLTERLYCWGSNREGQLGLGNYDSVYSPRVVPTAGIAGGSLWQIETGGEFTCGLAGVGQVYCWGADGNEQLGDGIGPQKQPSPVAIVTPSYQDQSERFEQVVLGWNTACALTPEQRVYCWGQNSNGEAGLTPNSPGSVDTPHLVEKVW